MKNSIGVRIVLLALVFNLLLAGGCASPKQNSQGANGVIYLTPAKGEYPSLAGLTRFVFKQKENSHANHFAALKVKNPDRSTSLLLFWYENHRLFFLGGQTSGNSDFSSVVPLNPVEEARWVGLSKSLDFPRDVVERPEDVDSSTYLVTRAWAEEIQSQCQKHGLKLSIPAFLELEADDN